MFFSFDYQPYIAIIADIKNSRKIKDRNEVQKKLRRVLEGINQQYHNDTCSRFTITLGDEFQGLLRNGANTMHIIADIERQMHPIKMRFGIGVGDIRTEVIKEMSIGADGPVYHNARKAIDILKEDEKRNQTNPADIRLEVDGAENQAVTEMINVILSLMTAIKELWSDRQREIIWDMVEHQVSQTDLAKRLGITQPSVQKSLSKGKYYTYKKGMDMVHKALEEIRR